MHDAFLDKISQYLHETVTIYYAASHSRLSLSLSSPLKKSIRAAEIDGENDWIAQWGTYLYGFHWSDCISNGETLLAGASRISSEKGQCRYVRTFEIEIDHAL